MQSINATKKQSPLKKRLCCKWGNEFILSWPSLEDVQSFTIGQEFQDAFAITFPEYIFAVGRDGMMAQA